MELMNISSKRVGHLSVLVYGPAGSGKTTFAATFPKPVFFASTVEGGSTTLCYMDAAKWYDRQRPPIVYQVSPKDTLEAIAAKATECVHSGEAGTIVIDPVNFLMDNELAKIRKATVDPDNYKVYGKLLESGMSILEQLHALPCHIVWVCGGNPSDMPGNFHIRLQLACSMLLYAQVTNGSYEIRTACTGMNNARHRFNNEIPDPLGVWVDSPDKDYLEGSPLPEFRAIEQCLALRHQPQS